MGQARLRAAAREQLNEAMIKVDLPRLSAAMRKLASAASGQLGGDCYIHSSIAQAILGRMGVEAKIITGFSAWRLGNASGDVIVHAPIPGMPDQPGLPYHVWLEIGSHILDLTTWSLRLKSKQLDELDGGHTNVDWCPDFLYVPKRTVSSLKDVTNLGAGLYYYEFNQATADRVNAAASAPDEGDIEICWTLYNNPALAVYGPNDVPQNALIISQV